MQEVKLFEALTMLATLIGTFSLWLSFRALTSSVVTLMLLGLYEFFLSDSFGIEVNFLTLFLPIYVAWIAKDCFFSSKVEA